MESKYLVLQTGDCVSVKKLAIECSNMLHFIHSEYLYTEITSM